MVGERLSVSSIHLSSFRHGLSLTQSSHLLLHHAKLTTMSQPLGQPQPGHRLSRIKMPFASKPFKPKAQFSQHATVMFPSLHEDIERALATVFIFARPAGRDIVRKTDLGEGWAETLGSVPGGVLFLGLTKRDDQRTQAHAHPRC